MKLLFVDCDGAIREPASGEQFIQHPKDQRIIVGADKAVVHYRRQGWTIIGVTNQGGVAAGFKSIEDAIAEQRYTLEIFPDIFWICFCPDFEGKTAYIVTRKKVQQFTRGLTRELFASFRKPGHGMIELVTSEFLKGGMSVDSSYLMVGDRPEDEQCAAAAGIDFLWAHIWRQYG
ncbi:MAG: polynucleotide kinase [Nostoc sp. DedVER02]|uniref:polynucleotide kinase n=1 Tax=unclassified Nostoc TaxID=2593658 RepID=UPI002AD512D3|nr:MULTISPECIES: polynucleotide kinase [unclassified Nostoc]MDZ7986869.1 polynucleotide kinase [Nostoc sp. DedVER02]MDZ8115771.1 polynucleotide kinase [Nostoc sp. DedVER01b]